MIAFACFCYHYSLKHSFTSCKPSSQISRYDNTSTSAYLPSAPSFDFPKKKRKVRIPKNSTELRGVVNPSHNGCTARPWWPWKNWPPHWRLGRTSRKGWINFLPTNSASTWRVDTIHFQAQNVGRLAVACKLQRNYIDYRRCVYKSKIYISSWIYVYIIILYIYSMYPYKCAPCADFPISTWLISQINPTNSKDSLWVTGDSCMKVVKSPTFKAEQWMEIVVFLRWINDHDGYELDRNKTLKTIDVALTPKLENIFFQYTFTPPPPTKTSGKTPSNDGLVLHPGILYKCYHPTPLGINLKNVNRGPYCWWLKSCTTSDVWNPMNNGIFIISTGAGFLPSTVPPETSIERFFRFTFEFIKEHHHGSIGQANKWAWLHPRVHQRPDTQLYGNVWYLLSMFDFWGVSFFVGSRWKIRFEGVRMSCFLLKKLKGKAVILDESKHGWKFKVLFCWKTPSSTVKWKISQSTPMPYAPVGITLSHYKTKFTYFWLVLFFVGTWCRLLTWRAFIWDNSIQKKHLEHKLIID